MKTDIMRILKYITFTFVSTTVLGGSIYCRPMEKEKSSILGEIPCLTQGQHDPADRTGSRVPDSFSFAVREPSPTALAGELITLCAEAEHLARQLEQALLKKIGFQLAELWKDVHLRGFSFLGKETTEKKQNVDPADTSKRIIKGLETDFEHITISIVYLEQIKKEDEEKSEPELGDQLSKLYTKIVDLLCHINSMGTFEDHVTTDVMPESERNMEAVAERLKRDYVFARDLADILKNKKKRYIHETRKPCN